MRTYRSYVASLTSLALALQAPLSALGAGAEFAPSMFDTSSVSFGVAVRPICVADEKYSSTLRQLASSAALPRWHSSTITRSKKSGENCL